MRPRALTVTLVTLATLLVGAPAEAAWDSDSGSGSGYSKARALGTPAAPTVSAAGRSVDISWTAPGGGAPPSGYIVKRYDGSNQSHAVGTGCSGTVSGTSCTEDAVPGGTWTYKVIAVRGSSWRGAESAGTGVTVDPPSLTLAPTTVTSFPTVLSGHVDHFIVGQTVAFRLDDPDTGTLLAGSITPATIPAGGQASASVTIPPGTVNGSHTVYAVGSAGDQASVPITVERPEVSASVIAKSSGGRAGKIRPGGTYRVYAEVSGAGDPPAGLASLDADVSAITAGQTNAALTHGSYAAGGQSYNYRSAQLTADGSLSAGATPYTVTMTDAGGTATTSNFSVTVDDTRPTAIDVQAINDSGGTVGKAEAGDTLVLTYSEAIEPISILAGWDGTATDVVVRLRNRGSGDTVEVHDAADAARLPLGTTRLHRTDYTAANRTFGATGTPSTMALSGDSVTITLGTASGATGTAAIASAMVWTPSATATDEAGNTASTSAATESGAADKNF